MCFYSEDVKKKIATKNIVCYKTGKSWGFLRKKFKSEYKNFKYRFNKCYSTELGITGSKAIWIDSGFHSYRYEHMLYYYSPFNVKCIIPKGATYYENSGEYVSNQIIIKKRIRKLRKNSEL
jgi:hypothetical protein